MAGGGPGAAEGTQAPAARNDCVSRRRPDHPDASDSERYWTHAKATADLPGAKANSTLDTATRIWGLD